MRKSKSSASGISLRTGEVDAGYFHDQFSWESPAVGRGSMKRAATETTLHDKTAIPIAVKKNNFMRGPNSPSSATQQQSKAGGLGNERGLQFSNARYGSKYDDLGELEILKEAQANELDPKVFVPHVTAPGHTPRPVAIRRIKSEYLSQDLATLIEDAHKRMNNIPEVKSDAFKQPGTTAWLTTLPIGLFDDDAFEMYDVQKWVQYESHCRAFDTVTNAWRPARAVAIADTGATSEEKCEVVGIEVHFDGDGCQPPHSAILERLNVCFDAESPAQFANRVAAAYRARRIAEGIIRYNFYVDCMPNDELGQLDAEQIARVIARAMSTKEMQRNEFDTSTLLNEINVDYARTMNKIIFDANLTMRENKPLYESMHLREAIKPLNHPPAFGLVDHAKFELEKNFKEFVFNSFLVQPEVCYVLERAQSQCNSMGGLRLINTSNARTLTKEEYMVLQKRTMATARKQIKDDWPSSIVAAIKNGLAGVGKGHFDVDMTKEDMYRFSKLRKLLRRINSTMEDTLRDLTMASYENFATRVAEAGMGRVEFGNSISETRFWLLPKGANLTEEARARVGVKAPIFRLTVVPTEEKVILNEAEVNETLTKIQEWEESIKNLSDKDKEKQKCEIEPIKPNLGYNLVYDDSASSCVEVLLNIFDNTFEPLADIEQIERTLMDKLFWSTRPVMKSVQKNEPQTQQFRATIKEHSAAAVPIANKFLDFFEKYVPFLNVNVDEEVSSIVGDLDAKTQNIDDGDDEGAFEFDIKKLKSAVHDHRCAADDVKNDIPAHPVLLGGFFEINTMEIRKKLIEKHLRIAELLLDGLSQRVISEASVARKHFNGMLKTISKAPDDIEELSELHEYIDNIPAKIGQQAETMTKVKTYAAVLNEFEHRSQEAVQAKWKMLAMPKQIYEQLDVMEEIMQAKKKEYSAQQQDEQTVFSQTLSALESEAQSFATYTDIKRVEMVSKHVASVRKKIEDAKEQAQTFNNREALFELEVTEYNIIGNINRIFEPYEMLWNTTSSWLNRESELYEGEFQKINGEEIEDEIDTYYKNISKAFKQFNNLKMDACTKIASQVRDKVSDFKPHVPLIQGLRNRGIRQRHLDTLSDQIGKPLVINSSFTLKKAVDMGMLNFGELVGKVGETAGKEYQIEKALDEMELEWEKNEAIHNLRLIPYKNTGTFVLSGFDDLTAVLDEQITMTQAMQFSAFKKPFEERIEAWNNKLVLMSDVLEVWMEVQRGWLYLQPIFDSDDIMKQLPTEGKRFKTVDKNWRQELLKGTRKPAALAFCSNERLLKMFKESAVFLDLVQKGLSDYLETKRGAFARFYFLADDEILSILSETKDVTLVQPHLKKCFEGIRGVEFREDNRIGAMISGEKEKVEMFEEVDPNGKNVEDWMTELEIMMKITIRNVVKQAIDDYLVTSRGDWMQFWPGMCVLNCSQVHWTTEMEASMKRAGNEGLKQELEKQKAQLAVMISLVRGKLAKLARTSIGALTVIDVHARDVTIKMVNQGCSDVNDFLWLSQCRYYWRDGDISFWKERGISDNLYVQMVASVREYGYEYLGNSFRLVITPLTDKCYLTLMGALQMVLGGAPAGPAGTGKTETVKDLAKGLAKQCVVFNCGDGLDYLAMGKFFKGLAACGAWACFDEFNRIHIEVLSVVAQQIINLQDGVRQGYSRIDFEGSNIALDYNYATYITMNPGYAGRTELPENLAACFRPVAMMVPDYALIGEIMLIAFGFTAAKECGAKMVSTFGLCSEQLSSQCHYDYGMRAVKTVIVAAGNLKQKEPEANELQLLLRALQDVNLPKFLAMDLPLFEGIMSDLFPGIKRPVLDYGALMQSLRLSCESLGLQTNKWFLTKNIQLFETIVVRHGLMVVGPTGGGKSACINVLSDALKMLKKFNIVGNRYENVRYFALNPKSISMGQLYGEFDPNTREFIDGILPCLYRNAADDPSPDLKWVIFDGPVDAIWIENMNTVLDDNKKLCLTSGEMLQMSNTMSMMFEVHDLSVASPATVSRCGMVYMEPDSLGEAPIILAWLSRLPRGMKQASRNKLVWLFDTYLVNALVFLRRFITEIAVTVNNNLTASLMRIMDCFLASYYAKEGISDPTDDDFDNLDRGIESLFLFSLVWSVCITCNDIGRPRWNAYVRAESKAYGVKIPFPKKGTIYDYTFDIQTGKWIGWMDTLEHKFEYDPKVKFNELVVPTNDSVRNKYMLHTLSLNGKHCLMVGPTGTGKTVNIMEFLLREVKDTYIPLTLSFSARTSANQTQDIMDSKMEKRKKGVFGPPLGKHFLIYVDDFNMPQKEEYGAQPPLELIRQGLSQKGWYDRKLLAFRNIVDRTFIVSMGTPGGGKNVISERVKRWFNIIGYTEMDDSSKSTIYATILSGFLNNGFDTNMIKTMGEPLVKATLRVYSTILTDLLPTPKNPHYTFNLRDFSKVFQGWMMTQPQDSPEHIAGTRLWIHEMRRVFEDRLTSTRDIEWFEGLLHDRVAEDFSMDWGKATDGQKRIFYGDFMSQSDPRKYNYLKSHDDVVSSIIESLQEYNDESKSPMNLVLFLDAVEHVSRLARVLRQPQGNVLCLGVGGSGRQSLTRLATYLSQYRIKQIEVAKGYGMVEWREDVKEALLKAGLENKPLTFLFTDTQIVDEQQVEDINNILNTGDLPNLYAGDEEDRIINACRIECQKKRIVPTKNNIFNQYIIRVRNNLHMVICMSPLGDDFRNRLRMFPSLVNCCTIDWFHPWPEDALKSVAKQLLDPEQLPELGVIIGDNMPKCVDIFREIHQSVEVKSTLYLESLQRYNYVTPTSYLELLSTFKDTLGISEGKLATARSRYQNGCDKLASTKLQVDGMQKELTALQPVLKKTQGEVDEMMVQITKDKGEAAVTKGEVEIEEEKAQKKAAEVKTIADDAQRDLDEALPALAAAVKCLDKLNKGDIQEVRSLLKPPHGVKITAEAVCIMFQERPKKIADPDNPTGPKIPDYWDVAKNNIFKDAKVLLQNMKDFDKDNIPDAVIEKVSPYIANPAFTPESVKNASKACEAICMWVRAMHKYHFVARDVEPKRIALAGAKEELDITMGVLAKAQATLADVMARLKALEEKFNGAVQKKEELAKQVEQCTIRLDSAMKLISGLGGEEVRWSQNVVDLTKNLENVVGDVIVAAGTIAYLGAFTGNFRSDLCAQWRKKMTEINLPHSIGVNLNMALAEPVVVRQWNIWGLPTDEVSTENGVVIDSARRWPLCIDPQTQANKYIKRMASEIAPNGFDVVKQSDKNILRTLENGVRFGKWVIMENVGETLDAALEPILQKNVFIQGGQPMIRLGESTVPYNDEFKFYMTTKMPNPHYAPEVCVKVTLLNFAITMQGLESQLLGLVIKNESPEVEEKKNALVIQQAEMNKTLKELEDKILKLLAESTGNILDDVVLIQTLDESTKMGAEIKQRQAEALIVEKEIDESRQGYVPVAQRGAVLFFCITDLAQVDPMYQYSLTWFCGLFQNALEEADASDDLACRIENLNTYCTYLLYDNVSRSLFTRHKLLLSFTMMVKVLQFENKIDPFEWQFLLSGQSTNPSEVENPAPDWIIKRVWSEICALDDIAIFKGISSTFKDNLTDWKAYFEDHATHRAGIPAGFDSKLNKFQKMCVLRCLRPDKFVEAVQDYICDGIGQRFIEPPPFDLPLSFKASSVLMPLIFILSVGVDPMASFLNFAEEKGMRKKLHAISLGQGQGPKARKLIEIATERGEWVLLQNCHLCVSWMPSLEAIVEQLDPDKVHKDFRLWLSSMPSAAFPVSILQSGVKMTNEPPAGLRASLKNTFYNMTDESLNATGKPKKYKRLFFGLAFFHAVVIERKKYGALGWNIPYAFNETDLAISDSQLKMYLDQYDEVPFDVLNMLTSLINYGGRVTDDKDIRTVDIILRGYYHPNSLVDGSNFSNSGVYKCPDVDDEHPLECYNRYIDSLPIVPDPEVFSMHKNADITYAENDTYEMLGTVRSMQPRGSGGGGISRENQILAVAKKIEDALPAPDEGYLEEDATKLLYPITYNESMNTVLVQEEEKFNRLLRRMQSTLHGVQLAVRGLLVMSTDLEDVANSFYANAVPGVWESVAYVSLKPLSAWSDELLQRVKMITNWVEFGTPKVMWISGFFFPQAFLTGVRQNFARKYQLPIDQITYDYVMRDEFKDDGSDVTEKPEDGAYIWGLQLEGARFCKITHAVADSHPRELYSALPIMHLSPAQNRPYTMSNIYRCPVYKTLLRAGILSTTGHSTNFVCWVELPSLEPTVFRDSLVSETNAAVKLADAEKWIKAGVALFCQLRF